jgi:ribonucleoside-diphosphate reductase alpha chain
VSPSHYDVFACSMGDNTIHYMGHIKMMAAAQPFLSGAISKTVNMPEEASVEDVADLHMEAWKLGLKAVAIYRDNCKVAQPLATQKKDSEESSSTQSVDGHPTDPVLAARIAELEQEIERHTVFVKQPVRERMPNKRRSTTNKFRVADLEGYFIVGEYDDGRPGELFISVSNQGSTQAGLMDAFAVSISLGLQHGVPLSTYVKKYSNYRFEPSGMTDGPELRIATSIMDYIFRRIAVDYMSYDERSELGILTQQERIQPTLPGVEEATVVDHPSAQVALDLDAAPATPAAPAKPKPVETAKMTAPKKNEVIAPMCFTCGNEMQRAGACYVCGSCGSTSGCS